MGCNLRRHKTSISVHQQSYGYEDGFWKGPGATALLVIVDDLTSIPL